jgi:lipoate-protein ligase B
MHAPGEYVAYILYEKNRMEEWVGGLEKGMEDLFLQDVENMKITEGDETLIVTFDLKGAR